MPKPPESSPQKHPLEPQPGQSLVWELTPEGPKPEQLDPPP